MDLFDERVLTALKDGKPRSFTALLMSLDPIRMKCGDAVEDDKVE
jgi:hypothetical protein